MWISAEFKIYLIKEFQRLKDQELAQLGWDIRRNLTKINYRIHTDAIKSKLIPPELTPQQISLVYASESGTANPRANHSHRHTHKPLTKNAACVCHGEEVGAGFKRR